MSAKSSKRPSAVEERALLKDFQRRSLDRVFQRMYLDDSPTRRFLLADEVGLGKTLVARGVITRVIDHLWDDVDHINVLYLCSNGDIARQNVKRLTPRGIEGVSMASRITLLPIDAAGLQTEKVNLVALTPRTSLDLKGNLGVMRERALLVHLLRDHWDLNIKGACRMFAAPAGLQKFRDRVSAFGADETVDRELQQRFYDSLDELCRVAKGNAEESIRDRVTDLIAEYRDERSQPRETNAKKNLIIGELRQILAKSCLSALKPDLIILDEFQRFKDLLDGTGSAGEMAKQLFEYESATTKTRVLLMSATPYKMYTNGEEESGEDHYQDFVRTVRFLLAKDSATADRLDTLLKTYRRELFRLGQGGGEGLDPARSEIEQILRRVIVRTERLAVTPDRNGMLVEKPPVGVSLRSSDAKNYVAMQELAGMVEHADTIEYWKAAPWLLNFMDEYKFGDDIGEIIDEGPQPRAFVKAIESAETSVLPWEDVTAFRRLDPSHGRLRWLIKHTLDDDLWKVLWLPSGLGYYQLGEPFASVAEHSPTKALLFSAWRVVPRVVASVLSHEAERRMYVSLEGERKDLTDAPDRLGNQLQVGRKRGRVAGLSVLPLIYPSPWLARIGDPMQLSAKLRTGHEGRPTLGEILDIVSARVEEQLKRIIPAEASRATPDESWYWAAPILLDRLAEAELTVEWFSRDLAPLWSNKGDQQSASTPDEDDEEPENDDQENGDESSALEELVSRALRAARGDYVPGGSPPKDLARVLALMAVAGPGTVALRSFARVANAAALTSPSARDAAATVGGAFRTLYNQPDATAIIRSSGSEAGRRGDYWKQCLEYGASGCLQAVLDEYAHLLVEEAGVFRRSQEEVVKNIANYMVTAIGIRRAKVGVQNITVRNGTVRRESETFRSRFAMRYGEERADESGDKVRADDVRTAFNSPFWPFVLATTSVGQEGLDFHLYCHKVVHWNLPSNPVDLEQREGRVHRFKGHAVRKNVAIRHADVWMDPETTDPWTATFDKAKANREDRKSVV